MTGKLPAFQYYPKDWQADAVFGCSLAARGLWHEMMNVMHGCEPYGYLVENDKPIPDERIARKCGTTLQEYNALLAELDAAGVPRRTRAGIIYSKRMVEDQKKREEWRKRQQKHRHKSESGHNDVTRDVTPVSRPSSSPSPNLNTRPPYPPQVGGSSPHSPPGKKEYFQWRGTVIEVEVENRKRVLSQSEWSALSGSRPESVLHKIQMRGFQARIVPDEEVKAWKMQEFATSP